ATKEKSEQELRKFEWRSSENKRKPSRCEAMKAESEQELRKFEWKSSNNKRKP
ncbi:hypothetical protein AVEN_198684-1, partial [Araneus ventricosus]